MTKRYALVDSTGLVKDIAQWDGVSGWTPPTGMTAVQTDSGNIGDSYAAGVFTPPAPVVPVLTLAQAQAGQIATLSAACAAQIYAGYQSSALGAVHTYPAKDKDQANLSGSVVASLLPNLPANWTTPFWCEDGNGTWAFVPHTAAQIQQVGSDAKSAIVAALEKNASLAAQVMAAADVAAVQAIVW